MTTTRRTPPVLKTDSNDCDRCGKTFGIFTNKKNCFNCGLVVCESCSKYKTPLPQFGHLRPTRCCAYCAHFLQVSKMDKASLLQLNIRTLKGYLTAYNISILGMLEKQDLVEAIQSNRPLSEASETHFRENMPDTVENTATFYEEFSDVGGMWQEADRGSTDNFFSKLFGKDGTPLAPRKSKTSQPGQSQGKTPTGSAANTPNAPKPQLSGTQHERPRSQQYQQQQYTQQQQQQQQQKQQPKPQVPPQAQPTPQKPADGGPGNARPQAQPSAGAYRPVYNPYPTTPPGATYTPPYGQSTPFPTSMPMPMPNSPPYTPPQGTPYGYQQYPTTPPHSGPTPSFFGTYPTTQPGPIPHPYQPFPSQQQAYSQQNFGQQPYQAYPSYQQYPGHTNPAFPQAQPQPQQQQPYPQYPPQHQYQQQPQQQHQNPVPPMQPQSRPQPQPTQSSRPTSSYGFNGPSSDYSSSPYQPSTMYNAGDRPQASASSSDRPNSQPSPHPSPRPSPKPSPRSAERPTETNLPPHSQPRPQPSPQPTPRPTPQPTPQTTSNSTPGSSGFRSPQDRQEYAYQYSPAPEPNHTRPQHEMPERPSQARPTNPDPVHTSSPPPSSSSSSSSRPRVSSRGPQTSHSTAVLTLDEIISLDVETSTLSIKVLKSLLDTNCVSYVGVVEKADLVSRLNQLISETKAEQAEQKMKDDMEAAAVAARNESGKKSPTSVSSTYGMDSSNNGDDNLCKICLDASLNCVMLNCNHMSTCMDCGKKIMDGPRTCPICREFIVRLLHVFRA